MVVVAVEEGGACSLVCVGGRGVRWCVVVEGCGACGGGRTAKWCVVVAVVEGRGGVW